ncbi:dentin sialophosphoprotein isoform X2 [Prorops nasuta]|uniref:dentin sialophosphoprotein isoform X2 n=1 Tax=Prorops nasuta TaxID=863751 RepID=UPI0034D00ED5
MGGVQSGAHNLGEALWAQERQRQRCHREGSRHEGHGGGVTQDRRKLLKRTRSLAVISEDEFRSNRQIRHFRLSDGSFDLTKRHQLIPRAKLIDRNTLKDKLSKSQQHLSDSYERYSELKLCQSRTPCGLHPIAQANFSPFEERHPFHPRESQLDPDRLNILEWPEPPRRYRSIQALDTVSGLVDIVEDNWPIEGNRSIDCIYTQVKRKRKEHRSLDSILFEDEGELEYFDVLNLLPLSNVRLKFEEEEEGEGRAKENRAKSIIGFTDKSRKLKALEYHKDHAEPFVSIRNNFTDEEKCKGQVNEDLLAENPGEKTWKTAIPQEAIDVLANNESLELSANQEAARATLNTEEVPDKTKKEVEIIGKDQGLVEKGKAKESEVHVEGLEDGKAGKGICRADAVSVRSEGREKIEEAEDYKSIWISDNEEQDDMSRRPQILKVIDSDVTKRRHRNSLNVGFDETPNNIDSNKTQPSTNLCHEASECHQYNNENKTVEDKIVESARSFFERRDSEDIKNAQNEGRFERIVKETSNILGKACTIGKGNLGFEARSESSDLGLGSETGSDGRRRSMDDEDSNLRSLNQEKKHSSLTRSKSCMDSMECQDLPEFDHVRYKIVKSNVFGKNMFNCSKSDVTYEGLLQYLREYSFQELLLDNNVVIIEPVRAEPVELKSFGNNRNGANCKIAGAIQKPKRKEANDKSEVADETDKGVKCTKQSSIRKHFFYHPIRINRELIDDELPDPDTVRNVRQMFEDTLKKKSKHELDPSKNRKSFRTKDSNFESRLDDESEKWEISRSRSSSRAKDLTRLFESKSSSRMSGSKDDPESPHSESKTRVLAQCFESRSGQTSPSESNSLKKIIRYQQSHHWDAGSVSSGVSSDYPDTDPGSGAHCTSSEDEDIDCHYDDGVHGKGPGHYVSQDVLKKIRECGTSVTYYGGKVVNTCNGPLISPIMPGRAKKLNKGSDYVKFRLVKSNSCDSRLELTGRVIEDRSRNRKLREGVQDLRECTIDETPSIEISNLEKVEGQEWNSNWITWKAPRSLIPTDSSTVPSIDGK